MRAVPLFEIARSVHAATNPHMVMALLLARFDESGTEGDRTVAAYAGYCAGSTSWERIEKGWQRALDDFQAPPFHMVDLVHSTKGFEKFDRHRIGLFLTRLKKVMTDELASEPVRMVPLWSAIEKPAWDSVDKPDAFLKRFPKPIDLCFDHVVYQMRKFSKEHAAGTPVAPMFADSPGYTNRNKDVYDAYKRHPEWGQFLGPITFGSPRQVVSLQPSDMVAYEVTAYFDRLEGDYFREVVGMRYAPLIDDIIPLFNVDMSGCVGEKPLRRIVSDYLAGRPLWGEL